MFVLNYLYFLIISWLLLDYLNRRRKVVGHPLWEKQKLIFTGPEMFWTLLFSTGLLALAAPAGLNLMALRLFSLEIFCLVCLQVVKRRASFTLPMVVYSMFLAWLVVGLFYCPSLGYGIRTILKYLYPILVTLVASAVVRDPEVFLKASLGARLVALLALLVTIVPVVEWILFPGVFWYSTARAINYISITAFSLALFCYMGHKAKNLFYAGLFTLPCLLWVFRTSIMGTVVALMVFAFFRYRVKSLPPIALVFVMGVLAVFYVPSLKSKMFYRDDVTLMQFMDGRVTKDDINSNARFAMWEFFEKRFYEGRELQGSGTGACQQYFYTHHVFAGLKVMHSDMVQMKCDNGQIGLILYFTSILLIIGHSFVLFCCYRNRWVKICAITAGASMAGVAVTLYSDNVVNYSMCTLAYPFGFYGMLLGLAKGLKQRGEQGAGVGIGCSALIAERREG